MDLGALIQSIVVQNEDPFRAMIQVMDELRDYYTGESNVKRFDNVQWSQMLDAIKLHNEVNND